MNELGLADFSLEPHKIGEDLVWGFKKFVQDGVQWYLMEIVYRVPGDDLPVYIRDKRTNLDDLLASLLPIIGSSDYRKAIHDTKDGLTELPEHVNL